MQALQGAPHWGRLPSDVQRALLVKVFEAIFGVLQSAAQELLETMAKTQASLSKLGRVRNPPAAGNDGGLSDIEKTQKQLQLDITEFGHNVELVLGFSPSTLPAFQELSGIAQGLAQQNKDTANESRDP